MYFDRDAYSHRAGDSSSSDPRTDTDTINSPDRSERSELLIEPTITLPTRVLTKEREARSQAEHAERQARFLATAAATLSEHLDPEVNVAELSRIAIPIMGDWSCINLQRSDGSVHCLGVTHVDPAKEVLTAKLTYPISSEACDPVAVDRVLKSARPEVINDFCDVLDRDQAFESREPLTIAMELGMRSRMIVPLIARGRTLGTMSFMSEVPDRYGAEDLQLARELASIAALAIDNARLYQMAIESEASSKQAAARIQSLALAAQKIVEFGLDDQAICDEFSKALASVFSAGCVVHILNDDLNQLMVRSANHPDHLARDVLKEVVGDQVPIREGHTLNLYRRHMSAPPSLRTPLDDSSPLAPTFSSYRKHYPIAELLAVPLMARDDLIGGVLVWRDVPLDPFTLEEETLIKLLSSRSAQALENARLLRTAEQSLAAREEFLAVAAHELRTPLTTIMGYSMMLAKELQDRQDLPPHTLQHALEVQEQSQRLARLIADLLDNARLHQDKAEIQQDEIELICLAERVVGRASDMAASPAMHRLHVEGAEDTRVYGDAMLLEQAISNLVNNAIKYSPNGGNVWVVVRWSENEPVIEVSDQGTGISAEEQSLLFRPFSRTDSGRATSDGTGLGLYIVRQIAQLHGGRVEVESELGVGSCFRIVLPETAVVQ
jgi:signal transduction histidine kinase